MTRKTNNLITEYIAKDWFCLTIILLFCGLAIAPLVLMGIPDGNKDFPQHLQFAASYYNAIFDGEFLPSWAASDNFGFGSVGIRIYPPIASFSLALTKILTGNWFDAIWTSYLFWMYIGSVGVYYWAKDLLSSKEATIAAVLYIILPYHLLQIYQMWLYAEFVACAILPFCFLFAARLCRQRSLIDVILFAAAYSLLLLSHIPSAIIGSMSLAVYVLFLLDWKHWRKTFLKLAAAFLLSLTATSFYLVKLVTEIDWVKANDSQFSIGYYDPQQHLFPLFISAGKKYIERVSWHFDVSIFLTALLFLPSIIYLGLKIGKKDYQNKKAILAVSLTGLISFFMMSQPSSFIWSSFLILQKVQFPWRWLSVLSLISVLTFVLAIPQLITESKNIKNLSAYLILIIILSVLLFDTTQNIIQAVPLSRTAFEAKLPEMLIEQGCDCWWTAWAKSEAFERPEKVIAGSRDIQISLWKNKTREFIIEQGQPTNIRVATFYYPYWQAQVNGQTVQIQKDNDGSILIPVGGEQSLVRLYFQEPVFSKMSSILSLFTWTFLAFAAIFTYWKKKRVLWVKITSSL